MRPTRFDLLLQPSMAGLATEASANAQMHHSIQSSLSGLVDDVQYNRKEAESKRRFDTQEARLRESSIDLKREMASQKATLEREKQLGAQGDFEARLQALHDATNALSADPSEQNVTAFKSLVDSMGGPEVAQRFMALDTTDPTGGALKPEQVAVDDYLSGRSKSGGTFSAPGVTSPASMPTSGVDVGGYGAPPSRPSAPQQPAVAQPTVGPLGVPDRPSEETLAEAAGLEEQHKQIIEAQKALRAKSGKYSLLSDDQRAKAEFEWQRAESKRITIAGRIANLKSQGAAAARRETVRDSVEIHAAVEQQKNDREVNEKMREAQGRQSALDGNPLATDDPSFVKGYNDGRTAISKGEMVTNRQKDQQDFQARQQKGRDDFSQHLFDLRQKANDVTADAKDRAAAKKQLGVDLNTAIDNEKSAMEFWSREFVKRRDHPDLYTADEAHEAWVKHSAAVKAHGDLLHTERTGEQAPQVEVAPPVGAPGPQGSTEDGAMAAAKAAYDNLPDAEKTPAKAAELLAAARKKAGR